MSNFLQKIIWLALLNTILHSCSKEDTDDAVVTLSIKSITAVSGRSAICDVTVAHKGADSILSKGVCWNESKMPTIVDGFTYNGKDTGRFTAVIDSLIPLTKYYVRAYATTYRGITYSTQDSITSLLEVPETGSFTDSRDGHVYRWVKIGNQTWMAENLAYLPEVHPFLSIGSQTSPEFYVYQYEGTSVEEAKETSAYKIYGVLYNWPAAMNGQSTNDDNPSNVQGVCPDGWHMPSDSEWLELTEQLGGYQVAGEKLKEGNCDHWSNPNKATNITEFSALPGGSHYDGTGYYPSGDLGMWWSCTEDTERPWRAWQRIMYNTEPHVSKQAIRKDEGPSIRCIMN